MLPLIWQALVEGRAVQEFRGMTLTGLQLIVQEAKKWDLRIDIQEGRQAYRNEIVKNARGLIDDHKSTSPLICDAVDRYQVIVCDAKNAMSVDEGICWQEDNPNHGISWTNMP